MCSSLDLEEKFQIGIIKELYKKELISESQMYSAINKLNKKKKGTNENEKGSCLL